MSADIEGIDRDGLLAALKDYFQVAGIDGDWSAIEKAADDNLVISLAMACPFEPPEKQAILEAVTRAERAETLTTVLRMSALESQSTVPRQ